MLDIEGLKEQLKKDVINGLDMSRELSDRELLREIDLETAYRDKTKSLSVRERAAIRKELFDSLRRLDVLQELIDDDEVTEIMVNGTSAIFYEKEGKIKLWKKNFSNREKLEDVIQQIVSGVNRAVNTSSPIVDARLGDGSRVNVVLPPAAPEGPVLTIRRFPKKPLSMEDLVKTGSLDGNLSAFLKDAVKRGRSIFVSGGTGSGKTTFLNALSGFIPEEERVITIEDSLELQLSVKNLVRLETRNVLAEGSLVKV